MQSTIVAAICRVGIFMICAQMLVHFRPEKSYEKYLKMLVSIMILIQVLQPLSSLLNGRGNGDLWERAARFEEQMDSAMREAAKQREETEKLREQMSLEEIQRRLEEETQAENEGGTWEIAPVEEIRIEVE